MGCFTKGALFVINFAIFAAGVAAVVLASMIIYKDDVYGALISVKEGVFTLPIIILIVGSIIIIIGFLGCCGAVKGSPCMLKTYAFIIIVLLIAEITLAILLLVYPKQTERVMKKGMNEYFEKYGRDEATDKSIDFTQSKFHCCGVDGYKDWQKYPYGKIDHNVSKGCCLEDDGSGTCYMEMNNKQQSEVKSYIYTKGCYAAMIKELQGVTIGLGVVLIIMAIVQVLAVTCACGLAKKADYINYG